MKLWIFLLLFIFPFALQASEPFTLNEVLVDCPETITCAQRKLRFSNMKGDYRSLVHFKDTLRIMASDGGYQSFQYELFRESDKHVLKISFRLKPRIREIYIGFVDRQLAADPSQLITLKEGEFFESQRLRGSLDSMKKKLEGMGYPHNSHEFEVIEKDNGVNVNVNITLGEPLIFKGIKTNTPSTYINEFLKNKFNSLYNKPFELTRFKLYLDEAQKDLFNFGYYLVSLDFSHKIKNNRVILDIKVSNEKLFAFDFINLKEEDRDILHTLVKDLFRKYKRQFPESTLRSAIIEHYHKRAHLNAEVTISTTKYRNRYKENINLYRITLNEGEKTRLVEVTFTGNSYFSRKKIRKMFDSEAFELASINFYDSEFFNYFVGYLRSQYIQQGFVQARIIGPNITFEDGKSKARVEYVIQEGQRASVRKIRFTGLPSDFETRIRNEMSNQEGKPFNPVTLTEDIKRVSNILQENGYYFAEVTNANEDEIVSYSRSGSNVDIHLKVSSGPIVRLNRVIILGNYKTKKKVIEKNIPFKESDLIIPSKTRDIESNLSATGLFNSVNVFPLRHSSSNASTDLIVRVIERDYGAVEFAPGYRTDIGIKLTGTVSYMNIGGMNRAITLRGQVNQRLNYQTLDPRRRDEKKQLLEYNTSLTYTQGDVFNTLVDYSTGLTFQRKRFYSFDADILRVNNTFSRDLDKRFSASIRHQYENIGQFDATEERDNDRFRIGAITPSLTYDLRNNRINATKGAFFNMSVEFANPYFLSQKNDDLTINYYKLVSRNRFYIPFKNGTVAISLVGGMQENLAKEEVKVDGKPVVIEERDSNGKVIQRVNQTEGYIPNIKVFRLTGMDIVRGFNDEEINRLPDGRDISEARVQDRAYMANFKIEPRYFINDNFMAGLFYDAGRVFVDKVDLGDLRDSVGITFKILTPVGTLDFDYGIKLLRKKNADGSLEDPGRFHVSIGFF